MKTPQLECGFCYPREQGKHGEIKRQWSRDWSLFIPVCRKHSAEMEVADTAGLQPADSLNGQHKWEETAAA